MLLQNLWRLKSQVAMQLPLDEVTGNHPAPHYVIFTSFHTLGLCV